MDVGASFERVLRAIDFEHRAWSSGRSYHLVHEQKIVVPATRVTKSTRPAVRLGGSMSGSGQTREPFAMSPLYPRERTSSGCSGMSEKCQQETHALQHKASYSITSSARTSKDGGTVRPSALAVLRLITSSYLVGCSTGRSEGLVPLRILST